MLEQTQLSQQTLNNLQQSRELYQIKNFKQGLKLLQQCLLEVPDDGLLKFEEACFFYQLGKIDDSIQSLKTSIDIEPNSRNHSFLATIFADYGRAADSARHHFKAFKYNSSLTSSAYDMSINGDCAVGGEEYQLIKECLSKSGQKSIDYARLNMALGRIYLTDKNYQTAIEYFHKGNQYADKHKHFEPEQENARNKQVIKAFQKVDYSKNVKNSNQRPQITLIVGLPRSGTTLVEKMLNAHSQISGVGESKLLSTAIEHCAKSMGLRSFDVKDLESVTAEAWENAGNFLKQNAKKFNPQSACIVDKQLFNYKWLGCARLMAPDSSFIDIRRNPADIFISCYSMLFGVWPNFTHSIDDFIVNYQNYKQLMALWKAQFPENIVTVYYENLVQNPEKNLTKILNHQGFEYEPGCLDFYKSKDAVFTASQKQVRNPLYQSSVGTWDKFRKHFPEAEKLLKPLIDDYQNELEKHG